MVAAITESFWTTINPIASISLIIRMRIVYWKSFFMYIFVSAAAAGIVREVIVAVAPLQFNLPLYLILGVIIGPPVFYTNMVIASIMGRALFKRGENP